VYIYHLYKVNPGLTQPFSRVKPWPFNKAWFSRCWFATRYL